MKKIILSILLIIPVIIYSQQDNKYDITVIDSFISTKLGQEGMSGLKAEQFNNDIHLSYYMQDTSTAKRLMYAIRSEDGFTKEVVAELPENAHTLAGGTALQFDSLGNPYIYTCYATQNGHYNIYAYRKNGNEWLGTFVTNFGQTPYIVADPDGSDELNFAYWAPSDLPNVAGYIAYASNNGVNWDIKPLSVIAGSWKNWKARTKPSIVKHNNKTYLAYGEKAKSGDSLTTRIYVKEYGNWYLDYEDVYLHVVSGGGIDGLYTKLGASEQGVYLIYDLRTFTGIPSVIKNEGQGWQSQNLDRETGFTGFIRSPNVCFDANNTAFWINDGPNLSWIESDGSANLIGLPRQSNHHPDLYDLVIKDGYAYIYYREVLNSLPQGTPNTFKEIKVNIDNLFSGTTAVPAELNFSLEQNSPNPFSTKTRLRYTLQKPSNVSLKIYDVFGKEVSTIMNKEMDQGTYDEIIDRPDYKSGTYIYVLTVNGYSLAKKMELIR